jgi:hypothetical protein
VITNPRPLTSGEALVLCISAILVVAAYLRARRHGSSLPVAVAVALLASVAATAPFSAWAVIKDIRVVHDYSAFSAERVGPEDNGIDTRVIDGIARSVPRHDSYAIVFSPRLDPTVAVPFRIWTLTMLLPREVVATPAEAQWVITFGAAPAALGLHLRDTTRVASQKNRNLDAWVGRAL